ncbi:MAG: hypothetical protein JWO53_1028, partial [Chlamydiia bacterium]|nr:hypothetical protein [Chlamydiia bacterium]
TDVSLVFQAVKRLRTFKILSTSILADFKKLLLDSESDENLRWKELSLEDQTFVAEWFKDTVGEKEEKFYETLAKMLTEDKNKLAKLQPDSLVRLYTAYAGLYPKNPLIGSCVEKLREECIKYLFETNASGKPALTQLNDTALISLTKMRCFQKTAQIATVQQQLNVQSTTVRPQHLEFINTKLSEELPDLLEKAKKSLIESKEILYKEILARGKKIVIALINSSPPLAIELIERGLDIKGALNEFREGVLHVAVRKQDVSLLQALIQTKPDINQPTTYQSTPLHFAAHLHNFILFTLLIEAGGDPMRLNWRKENAYQSALSSVKKHPHTQQNAILFWKACLGDTHPLIDYLNKQGFAADVAKDFIKPELQSELLKTAYPLELAYLLNSYELASAQLENCSMEQSMKMIKDIEIKYKRVPTLLLHTLFLQCLYVGDPAALMQLIEEPKFNPSFVYPNTRNTILHTVVMMGDSKLPILEKLLKKGTNPNVVTAEGNTPLHLAALHGHMKAYHLLLQANANPLIINKKGLNVAQNVIQSEDNRTTTWLWKIFEGFSAIQNELLTPNSNGEDKKILPLILNNPKHFLHTTTHNPLEIAFLFQKENLTKACYQILGDTFYVKLPELQKKYTGASTDSLEFSIYTINNDHFKHTIRTQIPKKPEGTAIRDLLSIFQKNPLQELPEIDVSTARELEEILIKDLIEKIEKREAYVGTPTDASMRELFYQNIQNAICHTMVKLNDTNREKTFIEYLKYAKWCGTRILDAAFEKYDEIVLGLPPTFEQMVYQLLSEFRKDLLDSLAPSGPQNIHDAAQYFFLLADDLNLPNKYVKATDPVAKPVVKEIIREKFDALYNSLAIIECIQTHLQNSGEFRNRCLDYLRAHTPADFEKDTGLDEDERIANYLKSVCDSNNCATKQTIAAVLGKLDVLNKI